MACIDMDAEQFSFVILKQFSELTHLNNCFHEGRVVDFEYIFIKHVILSLKMLPSNVNVLSGLRNVNVALLVLRYELNVIVIYRRLKSEHVDLNLQSSISVIVDSKF